MFVEMDHLLWKRLSRMKKQGDKRLQSGRREAKPYVFFGCCMYVNCSDHINLEYARFVLLQMQCIVLN